MMYACINTQVHTHIYICQISVDGHLGCFYILAIVNDTAVNIRVVDIFSSECSPFLWINTQEWNYWII